MNTQTQAEQNSKWWEARINITIWEFAMWILLSIFLGLSIGRLLWY